MIDSMKQGLGLRTPQQEHIGTFFSLFPAHELFSSFRICFCIVYTFFFYSLSSLHFIRQVNHFNILFF